MTIKELAALITVFAGIVANLMFQDSLVADGGHDWSLEQLNGPSPWLQPTENAGPTTNHDGVVVAEVVDATDLQSDGSESMTFVPKKHPVAERTLETDSDCD